MTKDNYALIMAGGIGSRFWPLSTNKKPKQFLDILGTGKSLIQLTFERLIHSCPKENIFVVTSNEYEDLVKEHIPELPVQNIISEPVRRNTAPCVAYGCYKIYSANKNAKILVAPSDHLIINQIEFNKVIKECFEAASDDILITLGIQPTRPETGYGYIQSTNKLHSTYSELEKVKTFTEKPNKELAKVFLNSGDFYWNSGMFVWSAESIVKSFFENCNELHEIFKEGFDKYGTEKENEFVNKAYALSTSISVDYAILEKAKNIYVHPCDIGWTDLGTWGSLYTLIDKDEDKNATVGNAVKTYDCKNSLISNNSNKLIVAQGLKDHIVINTDDILLICKKDEEQRIKGFVNDLSEDKKLKKFI